MASKTPLNEDQKEAFKLIRKFLDHQALNTFVLKGYAGTGKTYLMQHLATWLEEHNQLFSMLASTGRAATILRGKSGFTPKTVHSALYKFFQVDGADQDFPDDLPIEQHGQLTLQFGLKRLDDFKRVYIVDEASMLSSEMSTSDAGLKFGSGNLLADFFEAIGFNKVIFVGDPGQLPPVGQVFSPALSKEWLMQQNRLVMEYVLQKIERTDSDNDILILASEVRSMSENLLQPNYPKLSALQKNNAKVHNSDKTLFDVYVAKYKELGPNHSIAIARSNRMVQDINRAVRRDLYGELDLPLKIDDVLLVTHNNYSVPLTNGDFVMICELGEIRLHAKLHFQNVKVKALSSGEKFDILLSLDILYGKKPNFSQEQLKVLMIDFNKKMKKKEIKPNTEEYNSEMLKDEYLNCLRSKYGYAVTCHKAQGGEWDEVFLFLEKSMYRMNRNELYRWWYTAITRARKVLHLSNHWWIE